MLWKCEQFAGRLTTAVGKLDFNFALDENNKYVLGSVRTDSLHFGKAMDMPDIKKVAFKADFKFDISKPRTAIMRKKVGGKLPMGEVNAEVYEAKCGLLHVRNTVLTLKSNGAIAEGNVNVRGKRVDLLCSFSFTNTNTETIDIYAKKEWDDADDQDGIRPSSVKFQLKAGNENYGEAVEVSSSTQWACSWTELYKYDQETGAEITYTVTENAIDNYTPSGPTGTGTEKDPFVFINSYAPGTTSVTVSKVWVDANNQDGIQPKSVEITLLADGKAVTQEGITAKVTLSEENKWTYTWTGLNLKMAGKEIDYTVEETKTDVITGTDGAGTYAIEISGDAKEGYTVTNTHTPETMELKVTKVWDDNSNQDGKRPENVKFTVTGSDGKTYEATLSGEGDTWTATIEDVVKYSGGKEVIFTVDEETVSNYDKEIDNDTLTITNSYTPGKITVTIEKIWVDNENQDGVRPEKLEVILLANGEKVDSATLTEETGWKATLSVDEYADGKKIEYTADEPTVPTGYTKSVSGLTITNTHTTDTIDISGTKTWVDNDNKDSNRPESITVNLLANGKKVDSKTVTAKDDWKYTFTDLPKNENGKAITYTITEDEVEGYTTTISGYDITNTYNPDEQTVTVKKIWDDNEDQDGVRPESLTVNLLVNGEKCDTQTLSESSDWAYTWEHLPKKQAGKDLTYTVEEDVSDLGDLYEAEEPVKSGSVFTITNTHVPEELEPFTVKKVWNDDNNKDGIRPSSITVKLLANGETVETVKLNEANDWTYTFKNLPKYADGSEIEYTVEEPKVNNYDSKVTGDVKDGFTVTNTSTYTPPSPPPITDIRIEIIKVWEDNNNASGIRTDTVEVTLMVGDVKNLTRNLGDPNDWKYECYMPGGYDYRVVETPVEGYDSIVTQSPIPGGIRFTVTNKLTKTPDLNTKDHVAYIIGYPDGTVRPDRQITRAEVATIFFRLLTDEARDKFWSQTNPYPDVKADDWFNNAISTLTKMGIINGYEDGTFRPNNPITRAELTKMAVSFFSSADKFFGKTPSFSDVPADAWYTRFIAAAEELGLINGYPDGTFRPNNYITRAETCTIVNRTLGRGPHKDHLLPEEVMINWPDNLPTQWYYEQIQEATNSHDYEWITEIIEKTTVEQWLAKLPERDWVALEQIWSTAHSAPGGEVMG